LQLAFDQPCRCTSAGDFTDFTVLANRKTTVPTAAAALLVDHLTFLQNSTLIYNLNCTYCD